MRLPSKITPYSESSLPQLVFLLELLQKEDLTPSDVLAKAKGMSSSEAIECLDVLFALGMIEFGADGRSLHYAGRD